MRGKRRNVYHQAVGTRRRDGKSITFAYDNLDRKTTRTVPANAAGHFARTLSTSYDLASRKWDVVIGDQTLAHRYDTAGRLDTVSDSLLNALGTSVGNLDYAYDAAGNRSSATVYSLGTSWTPRYTYDDAERLATVKSSSTTHATMSYDPLSRLTEITFADASTTAYTYENDGDLATLAHTFATGSLSWGYSHNGVHQITSQTVSDNGFENKAGSSASYSVNALNQYTAVGGASPGYDANGNLTGDGTWTFEYDEENRLRSATKTGTTATYDYDPLGRRRSKTVNGVTTYFVNDGANEVAELDATGTRTRLYADGAATDQHLGVYYQGSGGWRYLHANHQGSVVLTTNASGIVGSASYGPYGESSAAGNAFGYTGRYLDAETGLYYYRARYYSAQWGRFLQTDPIGTQGDLNPYAYVGGDPANAVDPSGLRRRGHRTDPIESRSRCAIGISTCGDGGSEAGPLPEDGEDDDLSKNNQQKQDGSANGLQEVPGNPINSGAQNSSSPAAANKAERPPQNGNTTLTPGKIDETVVAGAKSRSFGGVKINFNLPYPQEQLWVLYGTNDIVYLGVNGKPKGDLGENSGTPPRSGYQAIIHTHPAWAQYGPGPGDFGKDVPVYGIARESVWVIRPGATSATGLYGRHP